MKRVIFTVLALAFTACASSEDIAPKETGESKVILASDAPWEKLNPARGDKSPMAATVWGDRNGKAATGFLFHGIDGFQSPPHIHNVTYRGVVLRGLIHNDDAGAEKMWMPAGSYWTQPAGQAHITAAKGKDVLAYIEIEEGPYLVRPTEKAFDNGERPINVDPSNIVWLPLNLRVQGVPSQKGEKTAAKIAFLWGQPEENQWNGSMLKLPQGFSGVLHSSASFRAVLVKGQLQYSGGGETGKSLDLGSSVHSKGVVNHRIQNTGSGDLILYIRSKGQFKLIEAKSS